MNRSVDFVEGSPARDRSIPLGVSRLGPARAGGKT